VQRRTPDDCWIPIPACGSGQFAGTLVGGGAMFAAEWLVTAGRRWTVADRAKVAWTGPR
jgi:hypothetical protein